jgi:hypothetical protein
VSVALDVFACPHCEAAPELVIDGRAQLSIVRHARPGEPIRLPDTPAQIPL